MQEKMWGRRTQRVIIASLIGIMAGAMANGDWKPQQSGKINESNSATASVMGGNVGTQVAINKDALGGIQACLVSSMVASGAPLRKGSSTVFLESTLNPSMQTKEAITIAYDPLTDRNIQDKDKPVDTDKAKDLIDKFQQGQWQLLDKKEQNLKNQPPAQPQPPEYLNKTNTTVTTPISPAATPTAPTETPTTPTTTTTPTETPTETPTVTPAETPTETPTVTPTTPPKKTKPTSTTGSAVVA